ncbi:MAG TPA: hypothetical protein VGZ00_02650 [Candidatus Baltobacteraceae bacterium]|nr:hypothetical protein [Candidatus Baltobacteraceae bacterium]
MKSAPSVVKYLPLVVALVCFAVALLYATGATSLGYHLKHSVLFAILGVLALVGGRFLAKTQVKTRSRAGSR